MRLAAAFAVAKKVRQFGISGSYSSYVEGKKKEKKKVIMCMHYNFVLLLSIIIQVYLPLICLFCAVPGKATKSAIFRQVRYIDGALC